MRNFHHRVEFLLALAPTIEVLLLPGGEHIGIADNARLRL